jgi:hypothetical protein
VNTKQLLDQDKIWQTRDGMPIPLERMDPGHRSATLAFLRRRADYLAEAYAFCELRTFANAPDEVFTDWISQNERALKDGAQAWLERRPLIQRLVQLVAEDQRGPVVDGEVVVRELNQ